MLPRPPSPARVEAFRMKLRRELAATVAERIRRKAMTQVRAAELLGITQPRLNALLNGRTEMFSLDALVDLAQRSGLSVSIKATRPYSARD